MVRYRVTGRGRLLPLAILAATVAFAGLAWAQSPEYRIGPRDVLRITVWGHDDLTRSVAVSADGTFAFPLVGDVPAAGLTTGQLEARLRALLEKDYLVNPQVSVKVEEYRSQRVFVLGEVEKPGTYTLTGPATLLDVLSQAGGPSKSAGRQVVIVRVPQSDGPAVPGAAGSTTLRANLHRLLEGDVAENLALQNGDTIYVPKLTSFFVLGEVQRQGAYAMDKDTTALEAVTLAGGFTDRAAPANARILRRRPDGTQATIEVDLSSPEGRGRETVLAEGDTLVVPRGNTFFVSGEVRRPGVYQLDGATTAFAAITLAGGFTERAGQAQVKLIRRLPSGGQETVLLDFSIGDAKARDWPLKDGDILLVPAVNTFFVLGEVKRPGAYYLDRPTTAFVAVTQAGGFTDRAAASETKLIRRHPSGAEEIVLLDLAGADPRAREAPLAEGDTLLVPAGNAFYVLGEVRAPGGYALAAGTTAIQGIALAGGFTDRAAPNRTKIIRTHKDGRQETLVVDLNEVIKRGRKDKDVPLAANDVIVVPESLF